MVIPFNLMPGSSDAPRSAGTNLNLKQTKFVLERGSLHVINIRSVAKFFLTNVIAKHMMFQDESLLRSIRVLLALGAPQNGKAFDFALAAMLAGGARPQVR